MPARSPRRYAVSLKPSAERELKKLKARNQQDARRIIDAIAALADNPRPDGVKALQGGDGVLRLRVGDYRILYMVDDGVLLVLVVSVGHRRDVYRL